MVEIAPSNNFTADGAYALLKVGISRHFGVEDIGSVGLTSGWALPEEGQNWNDGCEAVLDCRLEGSTKGCVLEFSGQPFFCDGVAEQALRLHLNGFYLGSWRLTEARQHFLSARIEPEQIFRRGVFSVLKCVWSFPRAVRPAEKGISSDGRGLAFCFHSITVLPA